MIDPRLKLRHLRTFLEVARLQSVGRAATALHVTQPAVTKTVRELEETLGTALLERDGRRIRLTGQGEVFLRHAGMAMTAIRQGIDTLAAGETGPQLKLGTLPTASARVMPGAMRLYMAENPAARVRIVTGENAVLLEQLRLGELDLVVGRLAAPERMLGFSFEHLYSEAVVFVVRAGHPLLAAGTDIFGQLGRFPLLMPSRSSIIRPLVERFFITRGIPRPVAEIETVSDSFGRAFVRGGDAVWAISQGVVAGDLADGTLAALPLDTDDTKGPVGLTIRTDGSAPPGLELLMLAIRKVTARFVEPG
jgi:LysR family pca operon transcriptional activator